MKSRRSSAAIDTIDLYPGSTSTLSTRSQKTNWLEIIHDWEASAETQKAFCKARGIDYRTFIGQRSKLATKRKKTQRLLPVKLTAENPSGIAVRSSKNLILHFQNGATLSIPTPVDPDALKIVLSCLGGI